MISDGIPMSNKLKSLLENLDKYDESYEIERWQLQVHTFLALSQIKWVK